MDQYQDELSEHIVNDLEVLLLSKDKSKILEHFNQYMSNIKKAGKIRSYTYINHEVTNDYNLIQFDYCPSDNKYVLLGDCIRKTVLVDNTNNKSSIYDMIEELKTIITNDELKEKSAYYDISTEIEKILEEL